MQLTKAADRRIWFDGYVRTYLERDLQDLATISALPDFRRLMRAACLRVGQLVNQTELGRDVSLPQPTVHRWLNLLETSYLLVRLPAYAVNRTKRLIKAPKIYWGDTGIALHLAEMDEPAGAHLENVVLQDLLAWRDARIERAELGYWRTAVGEEVDFVIEAGGKLLPIEVKATTRPRLAEAAHLRTFRQEYGKKSRPGPGRTSSCTNRIVQPCGAYHCIRYSGRVQASNTSSRGASNVRSIRIVRESSAVLAGMAFRLLLQQHIEPIERFVPELLVSRHPVVSALEWSCTQRAELLTAILALLDQARAFEIGQMLRDRLLRNAERLGELVDRCRALAQPVENHSSRRIGQGQESQVQRIHNPTVVHGCTKANRRI